MKNINIIDTPNAGEILLEEFMKPLRISAYKLAHDINVPVSRIHDIIKNKRRITVDTSLRLSKYFGLSECYFLNIQNDIDIRNIKHINSYELEHIVPFAAQEII
nr:HigA family addiction module antitoxin [Mucispirillum schaedleri]